MRVTIYYGGNSSKHSRRGDDDYPILEKLLDNICIDLQRVPCQGECMSFVLGDYCINAMVARVYTNYTEPGNPHIRPEFFGDRYAILLDDAEIVEEYKTRKAKED